MSQWIYSFIWVLKEKEATRKIFLDWIQFSGLNGLSWIETIKNDFGREKDQLPLLFRMVIYI